MKKGYPRGGWPRPEPQTVEQNHSKIARLREQGVKLSDIAKQVGVPYGSVLYVVYRKPNQLWQ